MTKRTLLPPTQSALRRPPFVRIAAEFALFFVCLVLSATAQTVSNAPTPQRSTPAVADANANAASVPAPDSASPPEIAPSADAASASPGSTSAPSAVSPLRSDAKSAAPFVRRSTDRREKPTFWLSEEDGSWRVPLPNWTLEEVMRTIDGDDERAEQTPYSIQKINAFGAVEKGVARLDVVFTVQIFSDELVRVPLGLQEGVYIPTAKPDGSAPDFNDGFSFKGPEGSRCELDVDPETGAYVALVRPPRSQTPTPDRSADSPQDANAENARADDSNVDAAAQRRRARQYELALQLCFAVETLGLDEHRLVATFPPSVNSQLLFTAPTPDAKFKSVKGALQGAATPMDESTTNLTLHGLGRGAETTDVVWRKQRAPFEQNVVVHQVEDATLDVRLDARETVCEATLPVRVFGGETETFKVRLPVGASLVKDEVVATDSDGVAFEIRELSLTFDDSPDDSRRPETLDASENAAPAPSSADGETAAESGSRADAASVDARSQTLEIKLAQKTNSAILKIKTRTPAPENAPDAAGTPTNADAPAREIAGFEVDGAQKQHGRVKVSKADGLDFDVAPLFGIRADVDASSALADGEELYVYSAQPFALAARPFVRRVVVNVKPEYQAVVDEKTATLRAKFQYSVYGSKIDEIKIRLRDWNCVDVAPSGIVDVINIESHASTGETAFPLVAPTDGVVEFELFATRELAPSEDGAFSFPLPTASGAWSEPSTLVVVPVDAIDLTPAPDDCVDLTSKPLRALAPTFELPQSQQSPLAYQTRRRGDSPNDEPPRFAARVKKQEQKIEIEAKTDVHIGADGSQRVEQTFRYNVEREPLDSIALLAPSSLGKTAESNLKIFVDGKAVPTQNATLEETAENQTRRVVSLADAPKIGSCVVSLHYEGKPLDFDPNFTRYFTVDLAQPENGTLLSNELTIFAPPGVSVQYNKNKKTNRFWRLEDSGRAADGRSTFARYASATQEFGAAFTASLDANDNFDSVIVDRAWLQTWLSDVARVDRVAYRLSGYRDRLALRLPDAVRKDRVAVSLDGVPFSNVAETNGGLFAEDEKTLVVPIPESVRDREYVLELSYVVQPNATAATSDADSSRPNSNRLDVQFPRFVRLPNADSDDADGETPRDATDDSIWIRRAYWQVLTPFNRHVVVEPDDWTPEYVLRRDGFLGSYRRVASISQTELCDWVGVAEREAIPLEVNSYLFSGFGQPERSRLFILDRALLILLGGGAALATGLGLLYFPFFRSRSVLFVFALTTTALVALRPYLAFLFLQTTVFGVLLTLGAALLAKFFGRKDAKTQKVVANVARSAARETTRRRFFGRRDAPRRADSSRVVGGDR